MAERILVVEDDEDLGAQIVEGLAVYAGLRKGEVAGLIGEAIDFDRGIIRVDRSYDGPTKSRHARFVPLARELAKSLRRWRLGHGGGATARVVLADSEPIDPETEMARRSRRACKRAGVPSIKFHELRATYASRLAERVSLPIVGAVLGHADVRTTARPGTPTSTRAAWPGIPRDPRLPLTFQPPSGKVLALPHSEPDCTRGAHDDEGAATGSDTQLKSFTSPM